MYLPHFYENIIILLKEKKTEILRFKLFLGTYTSVVRISIAKNENKNV